MSDHGRIASIGLVPTKLCFSVNGMGKDRRAIHVLIVDDHLLFRETLKKVFETQQDILVIGEASDGGQIVELAKNLEPDILLLDWHFPQIPILDVLRSVSASSVRARIILLGLDIDDDQVLEVFQLGARGLVMKQAGPDMLLACMQCVMAGHYWIHGQNFSTPDQVAKTLANRARRPKGPTRFALTRQELKVVAMVASGYTNRQIAKQLSISEQTVKHHVTNIFDKLGVYNRLELTLFALHHKLIDDSNWA